jgi:hypothetical protein
MRGEATMFATALLSVLAVCSQSDSSAFPPPSDYRHDFEISQEYDKFRDATTLKLDFGEVWRNRDNKLKLQLTQYFKGNGRQEPFGDSQFRLLNVGDDGWRYLDHHPVTFLVDSERITVEPKFDGTVGKGYVLEYMYAPLTKSQHLKILNAQSVQVRVGIDEFSLMEPHRSALKEFFSYLATPSRPLSTRETKTRLYEACGLEDEEKDDEARRVFQQIVELVPGSYEASEASRRIQRLDAPARREAYRKTIEAKAKAKSEHDKANHDRELATKIRQKYRLGTALEKSNPKGAISYYKEVVKLAEEIAPDCPEAKASRAKLKVLSAGK